MGVCDLGACEASYLELAEFLSNHGNPRFLEDDLKQLFRRVAFNVAVGNRDDHLRNHGFILDNGGWRLSPAFDVNPNVEKEGHVLNIDDIDNRPELSTVLSTAPGALAGGAPRDVACLPSECVSGARTTVGSLIDEASRWPESVSLDDDAARHDALEERFGPLS